MTAEAASEKKWLASTYSEIKDCYGTASHAEFVPVSARARGDGASFGLGEATADYEPKKLATFRVCCSVKGTVLTDPVLICEQLLLTMVFFLCAAPVLYFVIHHNAGMSDTTTVRSWVSRQEPKMREFAMIITGLNTFLLTFYSSMSLARWWTIRTQGVGGIKTAVVQLEWVISQLVTPDDKVLKAIRRYGRASLKLIFLWRRHEIDLIHEKLRDEELLTDEEIVLLRKWDHCLHETIWAWQMGIVTMLHKENKIPNDHVLKLLLEHCQSGRMAVQIAHTHIAQRIPMQYVHLLGFMVKMHNLILAVITGILFGAAYPIGQYIICCQLFTRTLLLPMLFNAILLMNADLSDPFNGASGDSFPDTKYCANLAKDCVKIVEASQHMPSWIAKRIDKHTQAV